MIMLMKPFTFIWHSKYRDSRSGMTFHSIKFGNKMEELEIQFAQTTNVFLAQLTITTKSE